jgi:hypothetical protein
MPDPIIKLDASGQASIISYNVPEPTSYEGTNIIELEWPAAYFTAKAKAIPPGREKPPTEAEVDKAVRVHTETGALDPKVFPNAQPSLNTRPGRTPQPTTGAVRAPTAPAGSATATRPTTPPRPAPPTGTRPTGRRPQ